MNEMQRVCSKPLFEKPDPGATILIFSSEYRSPATYDLLSRGK
jgi:hypothetical protein